jgi:hypothetical protein
MKKNKSYLLIILFITLLILSVTAIASDCTNNDPVIKTGQVTSDSLVTPESVLTTDSAKPVTKLTNGVEPTQVSATRENITTGEVRSLIFWNVGKLGGEQYSKATYTINVPDKYGNKDHKNEQTFEGYFTGGPNGEFYLSGNGKNITAKIIESGTCVRFDDDWVLDIYNPEAFKGWTNDATKQTPADNTTTAENIETNETTTKTEETTAKTDTNLMHGVVPTKVTGHTSITNKDGKFDYYYEFWNVGKLGAAIAFIASRIAESFLASFFDL